VQRDELPDPVDRADPVQAGVADAAGLENREVGQDDVMEGRGDLRRAVADLPAHRPGNGVQQAARGQHRQRSIDRPAPPRRAVDGNLVWRSAPPKGTDCVVHNNRGFVMAEEGAPYFPVKDLDMQYMTKPEGKIE